MKFYDKPTITTKQLNANKKIGWFVKDGIVKQVISIVPYQERVVGLLHDTIAASKPQADGGGKDEL